MRVRINKSFMSLCLEQSFLGDFNHRLLCAAQAAKMAAVYSQFCSLYVLTHMVSGVFFSLVIVPHFKNLIFKEMPSYSLFWLFSKQI